MDYKLQLLSLLVSFIYGIFFYFTSVLNFRIIKKCHKIFKYIITFIYMLDISILYVSIMYKVNNGYIHGYFLIMLLCGFIIGYRLLKVLKKNVKFYESIAKQKQKWYNWFIIRVILWIKGYLKKIREDWLPYQFC